MHFFPDVVLVLSDTALFGVTIVSIRTVADTILQLATLGRSLAHSGQAHMLELQLTLNQIAFITQQRIEAYLMR
jgi:hypothetical protein